MTPILFPIRTLPAAAPATPARPGLLRAVALALVLGTGAATGLMPLVGARPAAAQVVIPPQPVLDSISLTLSAEEWVTTATARVTLIVDAAGTGGGAGDLRADIVKAAAAVSPQGDWRMVALDRQPDDAGLERWQAVLEARLPEAQLAGLEEKTRKASRPGQQIRVGGIAFDPTLAEVEAVKSTLRGRIYEQVTAELKRLVAVFPDRTFRVGNISFMDAEMVPAPRYDMPAMAVRGQAMEMGAGPVQPGVQDQLRLTAHITLSTFAPQPAPGGGE
ncbi:MAG: hypothetical protein RLY86_3215 [Pseudomonadota bacterium]